MALTFYCGSGSPFAWRVWLALEHKQVPYELALLSFDKREHKTPAFLAINPRGKLPAIVHDGFALWESNAIVEYLDETCSGQPLFPEDERARGIVRRTICELDAYLYPAQRKLAAEILTKPEAQQTEADIAAARDVLRSELQGLEKAFEGDFLAGELSAADFAAYPIVRLVTRIEERAPRHETSSLLGPHTKAWMKRIEALPYFDKTMPPHWKA